MNFLKNHENRENGPLKDVDWHFELQYITPVQQYRRFLNVLSPHYQSLAVLSPSWIRFYGL